MSKMDKLKINLRGMRTYLREKPLLRMYFNKPSSSNPDKMLYFDASLLGASIMTALRFVRAYKQYGPVDFVSEETGEILFTF